MSDSVSMVLEVSDSVSMVLEEDTADDEDLDDFRDEIEMQCRNLGLEIQKAAYCADQIEANKAKVRQILKEIGYNKEDLQHEWFVDKLGKHVFGKQTNNMIRNCKGVCISPTGVIIGHWDQYGGLDYNRPHCKIQSKGVKIMGIKAIEISK
jgi:hypothetical protein